MGKHSLLLNFYRLICYFTIPRLVRRIEKRKMKAITMLHYDALQNPTLRSKGHHNVLSSNLFYQHLYDIFKEKEFFNVYIKLFIILMLSKHLLKSM